MNKVKKIVAILMVILMIYLSFSLIDTKGSISYAAENVKYGDVNCDGKINDADYQLLNKYINGEATLTNTGKTNADVNGDGSVNYYDLNIMKNRSVYKTLPTSYYIELTSLADDVDTTTRSFFIEDEFTYFLTLKTTKTGINSFSSEFQIPENTELVKIQFMNREIALENTGSGNWGEIHSEEMSLYYDNAKNPQKIIISYGGELENKETPTKLTKLISEDIAITVKVKSGKELKDFTKNPITSTATLIVEDGTANPSEKYTSSMKVTMKEHTISAETTTIDEVKAIGENVELKANIKNLTDSKLEDIEINISELSNSFEDIKYTMSGNGSLTEQKNNVLKISIEANKTAILKITGTIIKSNKIENNTLITNLVAKKQEEEVHLNWEILLKQTVSETGNNYVVTEATSTDNIYYNFESSTYTGWNSTPRLSNIVGSYLPGRGNASYFCIYHGAPLSNYSYRYYVFDWEHVKFGGLKGEIDTWENYNSCWYDCANSWILTSNITNYSNYKYDAKQIAIWNSTLHAYKTTLNEDANYITSRAYDYAYYISKFNELNKEGGALREVDENGNVTNNYVKNNKAKVSQNMLGDSLLVGPFNFTFAKYGYFGGISKVTLMDSENKNKKVSAKNWEITDKNGKEITVKSGTDFYIKLDNIETIVESCTSGNIIAQIEFKPHYDTDVDYARLKPSYYPSHQWLLHINSAMRKAAYTTYTVKFPLLVNFNGIVWEDGQTGIKPVKAADGIYQTGEKPVQGVKVKLYKLDSSNKVILLETTYTDIKGKYKFEDIVYNKYGYYITYEYDGVNYIATKNALGKSYETTSKAIEINRKSFNNKLYRIIEGAAQTKNGETETGLTYEVNAGKFQTSILETLNANNLGGKKYPVYVKNSYLSMGDGTGASGEKVTSTIKNEFKMTARTEKQTPKPGSTTELGLGIVRKGVDLELKTDLAQAKVSINGKSTIYTYGKLADENGRSIVINEEIPVDNVKYNLELRAIDYNFRIENYDNAKIAGKEAFAEKEVKTEDNSVPKDTQIEELSVEATYIVEINNKTNSNARVESIAYYYDEKYEFVSIEYQKYGSDQKGNPKVTNDTRVKNGYKTLIIENLDKDKSGKELNLNGNGQGIITLKFKIAETDDYIELGEFKTAGEILSYSTDDGLVDIDSEPGNMNIETDSTAVYEDDTSAAGALTVSVNSASNREISGYVFEDERETVSAKLTEDTDYKSGNGKYDKKESKINGVIVQLVEVVKIEGTDDVVYEYVWQETISGSDIVRKLSEDGKEVINYKYTTDKKLDKTTTEIGGITYTYRYVEKIPGKGEYKFLDYIPGNYMVRFIYGDVSTIYKYIEEGYPSAPAEGEEKYTTSALKYNAESYKSTVDKHYNEEWFSEEYLENSSTARDNEARRLEIMYNTILVTEETNFSGENGWMCAETSKISMYVERGGNYVTSDTNVLSGGYILVEDKKSVLAPIEEQTFSNANFGLEQRPINDIIFEKHVERLKITTAENNVITDAKVDYSNYYKNYFKNGETSASILSSKVEGIRDGLQVRIGSKEDEGIWQLETDIDELMSGAKIEILYRYAIINNSEPDYLDKDLLEILKSYEEDKDAESFRKEIKSAIKVVKQAMYREEQWKNSGYNYGDYVGTTYYTGVVKDDVEQVTVQISEIVDYVNNDLVFDKDNSRSFDVAESGKEYSILSNENKMETVAINTVLKTTRASKMLKSKQIDYDYTVRLVKEGLSATGVLDFPSYYTEVTEYITPTGRRINGAKSSLSFVYSYIAPGTTVETDGGTAGVIRAFEQDESGAEKIYITKPTGADKETPMLLAITVIASATIVAIGAIVLKKYVI